MLEFILTPLKKPLLKKWESIYGESLQNSHYNLDSIPADHQLNLMFRDIEMDILSSDILLHFVRAHKFIYAMTKIENLNFMINSSPFILDMIFDQAYSLIIKENMADFVNYNILGEFMIELSKK